MTTVESSSPTATSHPFCKVTKVLNLTSSDSAAGLDGSLWLLDLALPEAFAGDTGWHPGQFVMLRPASWTFEPLWARPFSICMIENDVLRIFFQVVGRGTRSLARQRVGAEIVLWGPLGNGFAVEPGTPTLLLAGGVGLAPFIGYVRTHPRPDTLHLLLGHRQPISDYPLNLLPEDISREITQQTCAEDIACFVGDLEILIAKHAQKNGLILACGPHPFLCAVQDIALKHRARAQISLENRMACGVGACLGCVAEVSGQGLPVKVCTQGPVFWVDDVKL